MPEEITIQGLAFDAKAGAVLETTDQRVFYIDGLDFWPSHAVGKNIIVRGSLSIKKIIPDPNASVDGAISQGAIGEQVVVHNAIWSVVTQ